jgi:hypothetical protein
MIKQSFFIHSTLLKLIAYLAALARNVCFMYTLSASTPRDRSKNFFLLLQFILLFILMKMNALIAALLAKRFFWRFYRVAVELLVGEVTCNMLVQDWDEELIRNDLSRSWNLKSLRNLRNPRNHSPAHGTNRT